MVTCWESADLFALVGEVNFILVTFQCGILGQMWYVIGSFPDLCHLSNFDKNKLSLEYVFHHLMEVIKQPIPCLLFGKSVSSSQAKISLLYISKHFPLSKAGRFVQAIIVTTLDNTN